MNALASATVFAQNTLTRSEFDIPENIAFAVIAGIMLFSAFKMVTSVVAESEPALSSITVTVIV